MVRQKSAPSTTRAERWVNKEAERRKREKTVLHWKCCIWWQEQDFVVDLLVRVVTGWLPFKHCFCCIRWLMPILLLLSSFFMHFKWWSIVIYLCKDDFTMAATTKLYNGIVIGRSTEHMLQPYTLFFGNSTFFMFHALLTKWQWISDGFGCYRRRSICMPSHETFLFREHTKRFYIHWMKVAFIRINTKRETTKYSH